MLLFLAHVVMMHAVHFCYHDNIFFAIDNTAQIVTTRVRRTYRNMATISEAFLPLEKLRVLCGVSLAFPLEMENS